VTATAALTTDLQKQVLTLEDDLRKRLAADPELEGHWKREHHRAEQTQRTAAPWVTWRDDRITQAAVAWVLTTVFIRFCEDNSLLRPVWITGPSVRRQEALDAQLAYFRQHPEHTDREWLQDAIGYLERLPATRALVDSHSALHLVSPSGTAAEDLLKFWRRRDEDGVLIHDLADLSLSTRFLGDLYQDLSQHAKDTYALLQTPVFVEEFILDRTLEPALAERPLEGFKLIDPACGSGHVLLGAFARLLDRWHKRAPDMETQARVQTALDAIHGVDLNPFAVAIARFRLTLAALQASGLRSLEQAPNFRFHLAVGDSLVHGPGQGVLSGMTGESAFMPFTYATEDSALLLALLEPGRYDVVVGNPPYITVKDKALNQIYRAKYADVCKGQYHLTVPFMKLFFALAREGDLPGWVGQIVDNGFMKREFGTKLIEDFLAHRDLRLVANTSGAYIPGHNREGTPTVILVARNQRPSQTTVRAVLRRRGEPARSGKAGNGVVWTSIVEHVDDPGWEDEWVTITDLDRASLARHPWSLGGGDIIGLLKQIERASGAKLCDHNVIVGRTTHTGSDECFYRPRHSFATLDLLNEAIPVVKGEDIRDYRLDPSDWTLFPYGEQGEDRLPGNGFFKAVWPVRTIMASRVDYQQTLAERGLRWFDHSMFFARRFQIPLSIAYAFKTSHNHFALDRGAKVFKQTAPVIKLPPGATEEEHLALLGALNSSTVCFWLRQIAQHQGGGAAEIPWSWTYEFSGSIVKKIPLPAKLPVSPGRMLDSLAVELARNTPAAVCASGTPTSACLRTARIRSDEIKAQMVTVQEELDWESYRLYALIDEDLTYPGEDLPGLRPGDRAFAIVMAIALKEAKDIDEGDAAWFTHRDHGHLPTVEVPSHWPSSYSDLVKRRIDAISAYPRIGLLERPEYKRRWESEPWEKQQERALREWLLDQLEDHRFWFDPQGRPQPCSVGQLADQVARDADLTSVLELWEGQRDIPLTQSLTRLLANEAVPFLAVYRCKETGMHKRQVWDETWALQRREDAGESVGKIPVPPKYTSADFRKPSYWQARGELDVPKERFISYPDAARETDPTPLLGWAGWDHAEQSLVLSVIIGEREKEGWADERLVPLVAGLAELQPWVEQWHDEVNATYGLSLAVFCREQLTARAAQVGKTTAELADWRPDAPARGRRAVRRG
jgi:hypothetical protein